MCLQTLYIYEYKQTHVCVGGGGAGKKGQEIHVCQLDRLYRVTRSRATRCTVSFIIIDGV